MSKQFNHSFISEVILLLAVCLWFSAFAHIIHVPGTQTTIQAGINAASTGDTVLVADGLYYENISFKGKAITVASNFIMDGDTNHINSTIINGSQPSHPDTVSVVRFVSGEDTTSILCGFTITKGRGTRVYVPRANRHEYDGGGIIAIESGAKIIFNKIYDNRVNRPNDYSGGGGILAMSIYRSNFIIVRNNKIISNYVWGVMPPGGGICMVDLNSNYPINYIIEKNYITRNYVTVTDYWKAMGGGIMCNHLLPATGTMVIRDNYISGNRLNGPHCFGGGVYIVYIEDSPTADQDPNPLIYNNIIADNYSAGMGGGITIWRFTPTVLLPSPGTDIVPQPAIINNTIVNNQANQGFGMVIINTVPMVMNNIIWNKTPFAIGEEIYMGDVSGGGYYFQNLYADIELHHTDIVDPQWVNSQTGVFSLPPQFADSTTFQLSDCSPCIGAGTTHVQIGNTTYTMPSTCYMGHSRPNPAGSDPDIGACESPLAFAGIKHTMDNISLVFKLHQNFPNPANPSTTIEFDLPKTSEVTLKVFNILGEEVTTLVSDRLSAGSYSYEWDASNLASGVYLYRLESDGFVQARKMMLMR